MYIFTVPSSRMYVMYQALPVHKLLHNPSTTCTFFCYLQSRIPRTSSESGTHSKISRCALIAKKGISYQTARCNFVFVSLKIPIVGSWWIFEEEFLSIRNNVFERKVDWDSSSYKKTSRNSHKKCPQLFRKPRPSQGLCIDSSQPKGRHAFGFRTGHIKSGSNSWKERTVLHDEILWRFPLWQFCFVSVIYPIQCL